MRHIRGIAKINDNAGLILANMVLSFILDYMHKIESKNAFLHGKNLKFYDFCRVLMLECSI